MRDPQSNPVSRLQTDSIACSACEDLLKKVNEARMHALLATAWAELRQKPAENPQVEHASFQLELAFAELEGHWREAHRMNC